MDPSGTVSGMAIERQGPQHGSGIQHPVSEPIRAAMAASLTGENGLLVILKPCFPGWRRVCERRDRFRISLVSLSGATRYLRQPTVDTEFPVLFLGFFWNSALKRSLEGEGSSSSQRKFPSSSHPRTRIHQLQLSFPSG